MNVRTYLVSVIALILLVGVTSSAEAVTVFFDDFNDDSGSLTGQTANSGQTWLADPHSYATGALDTGTAFGQAGTVGAGFTATSTGIPGNQVQFTPADPLDPKVYKISVDFFRSSWNGSVETDFELATDAGRQFTLIWYGTRLSAGGNLVAGGQFIDTGISTGNLHAEAILDTVNQTVSMSYFEIGNATNNGSKDLGDYGGAPFTFDRLTLEAQLTDGVSNGFDNASITTVEPVLGDYNGNTIVDAADYTLWRDNPDGFIGDPGQAGYDTWVANFGMTAGSGGSGPTSHAVPEPSAWTAVLSALGGLAWGSIGRASRRRRCPGI